MSNSKHTLTLCLICLLCTACAATPLSTIWKMRNFDPLSANPHHIRFAVIADKRVELEDGSTIMKLSFKSEDPQHSLEHEAIASIKTGAVVPSLINEVQSHQQITLFHLTTEDAASLLLAQQKLKYIKEQDIKGEGSMSISVTTGCFTGRRPESLPITLFAQFDPQQGYVKMMDDFDLFKELDDPLEMQAWRACDEPGLPSQPDSV